MIQILHTQAFDNVLDAIKRTIADDVDLAAVSLWAINDVVYELMSYCTERINIVDIDPDLRGLYQPFYEALTELLLLNNVPLLDVSNLFVDGPDRWVIVLVTNPL